MLTLREFEIYMLIVTKAYGQKDIARELNIAINTACKHRDNILTKMNMGSCLEMLVQYWRKELI